MPPPPPPPLSAPPPPPPSMKPSGGEISQPMGDQCDAGAIARAAIEARETGILDLNKAGLAKFPVGVIKLSGTDITRVDISNNRLESLPRDFASFNKVNTITAQKNRFSRFAVAFCSIPTLELLDLSGNNYQTLSEEDLKRFPRTCQVILKDNPLDDESKLLAKKYNFIL